MGVYGVRRAARLLSACWTRPEQQVSPGYNKGNILMSRVMLFGLLALTWHCLYVDVLQFELNASLRAVPPTLYDPTEEGGGYKCITAHG